MEIILRNLEVEVWKGSWSEKSCGGAEGRQKEAAGGHRSRSPEGGLSERELGGGKQKEAAGGHRSKSPQGILV